jgi:hypothetical protein
MESEVVIAFLASSWCSGVTTEGLDGAVRFLVEGVAAEAGRRHISARSIGVALDKDPADGVRFLERFGPFDEVIAGNGWNNVGVIRYVWADVPGVPSIPQVVVTVRQVRRLVGGLVIDNELLAARLIGPREVLQGATGEWVRHTLAGMVSDSGTTM